MKMPVYLDYAATTPVDPEVAAAMAECLTMSGVFANPASRSHIYGWQAEERVEQARSEVAALLGSDAREVIWTGGATESNNLALKGVLEGFDYGGHLVTSGTEHKSVLDTAHWLERRGVEVTRLLPGSDGSIEAEAVAQAIREDTRLVSLMVVNNETGVINPIASIGEICRQRGVLLHADAAQAAGRMPIAVGEWKVDLLSLSAHKFYGPKGVGALFVRRAIQKQLHPQVHGGGHERGKRSGTLATHQVVGMGVAARLARTACDSESSRLAQLRDQLWKGIQHLPGVRRNGSGVNVSPAHLNVCFAGADGETLILSLRELAVSTGSACTSASIEPSHVLKAMGVSAEDAHSSIRFSLGRFTTREDIERAVRHICQAIENLQAA